MGNTATNGTQIFLHGNLIAWRQSADVIGLTLAGWNTVTTRERLNGVLNFYGIGYRFAQRNFEPVIVIERDVIEVGDFEAVYFDIATQRITEVTA